jgi:hypothetical protein
MYYYAGPFRQLNRKPVDPNVHAAATAQAHEYYAHIDPAVARVAPYINSFEAMTFPSEEACKATCGLVDLTIRPLFAQTMSMTQADEQGRAWRQ